MAERRDTFLPPQRVRERFQISTNSLRRWAETGRVSVIRTPGGQRLYSQHDLELIFAGVPVRQLELNRARVCYARVSSDDQRADLDRQLAELRTACPNHECLSDIGSSLDWQRPQFLALLDRIHDGQVAEVVVTQRDRLYSFAGELVEWLFHKGHCRLLVLGTEADNVALEELRDDLLSVVTNFVGQQSTTQRRRRHAPGSQRQEVKDTATHRDADASADAAVDAGADADVDTGAGLADPDVPPL